MSEFAINSGASEGKFWGSRLGLRRDGGKASSSRGGPASGSPMRRRRRVEFVEFSEDVYSSVLDELVELS